MKSGIFRQMNSQNHFMIKYIIACFLILLICSPIYLLNENVGMLCSLFLLPIFILKIPSALDLKTRSVIVFVYIILTLIYSQISPTVSGPDAHSYYNQVLRFGSIGQIIDNRIYLFNHSTLYFFKSLDVWFPNLYLPYFELLNLSNPQNILVLNIFFWVLASFILIRLFQKHSDFWDAVPTRIYFLAIVVSPSIVYWSSVFNKDTISSAICIIALFLLFKKKYILLLILCILATIIRPWSIGIIGIYFLLLKANVKLISISALISIFIMLVYTKSICTLINLPIVFVYLFLSPNPLSNWGFIIDASEHYFITPLTIEGIIIGGTLIFSIPFVFLKRYRTAYIKMFAAITIFTVILIMIGFRNQTILHDGSYGIGTFGDNFLRKKLPIMPVVLMWVTITLKIYYNMYLPHFKKFKIKLSKKGGGYRNVYRRKD